MMVKTLPMQSRYSFFYSLVLIIALVVTQGYIAIHTAEHGVLEHDHPGGKCETCTIAQFSNAPLPSEGAHAVSFTSYLVSYVHLDQTRFLSSSVNFHLARAPPYFS